VKGLIRHGIAPVVEFIEHNADRPFFLWFAPMLPHLPHDAPERYEAPYADLDAQDRRYYAAIAQLDEGIGQLLARIRELGLEERTLFVYLTDNGWDSSRGEGASITLGGPKGKLSLYELGYRTPIVFTWKGHIAPQPPRSELVSSVDVYPTILDYAGASQPPQRRSHSLRPLIEGGSEWPRTDLVGWTRRVRAAEPQTTREKAGTWWRDARWHYLQPTDGRAPELYDVEADPRQTRDVADEHPDVVVRASARIDEWVRDVERREDVGPSPDTP
jgi:uncharacterized sulfatase